MIRHVRHSGALLFFALLAVAATTAGEHSDRISVTYYGDISCAHCDSILDGTLPELEQRYGVTFDVDARDIMRRVGEQQAREQLEELGLEYRTMPVLIVGSNAYQGNYAIDRHLPEEIEYFLEHERFRPFDRAVSETRHPGLTGGVGPTSPGDPLVLRYFWGVGCPFCEEAAPVIDRLERRYPHLTVERYEVFETRRHHDTFRETLNHYGSTSTGVPQIFFEDYAWIGFSDSIARQVEDAVQGRMVARDAARDRIELPFFGALAPGTLPSAAITAAIAFVDGFNPCSLWVLTLLLGLIVHTRSRRRILLVGGVFLVVTATIYGVFMVGLLNVFVIAGHTLPLRVLVGLIAVTMGAINVKDYFVFKRGVSLTIPTRFQRWITAGSRAIATTSRSGWGLAAMTALFAAGIALVELPCTAGFPVIWSQYVTATVTSRADYFVLLALYLLVYLALEALIIVVAMVTLGRIGFGEAQARPIKLIGGAIMVSLGVFYVVDPEIAGTLGGVGRIFSAALAGAAVAALLGRVATGRPSRRRRRGPGGR